MGKAERMDATKTMRGKNTELYARKMVFVLPGDWGTMSSDHRSGWLTDSDTDNSEFAFVPAASQSEGIRSEVDAKDWLVENNYIGSVLALRRRPFGAEKDGILTRGEQITMVIS